MDADVRHPNASGRPGLTAVVLKSVDDLYDLDGIGAEDAGDGNELHQIKPTFVAFVFGDEGLAASPAPSRLRPASTLTPSGLRSSDRRTRRKSRCESNAASAGLKLVNQHRDDPLLGLSQKRFRSGWPITCKHGVWQIIGSSWRLRQRAAVCRLHRKTARPTDVSIKLLSSWLRSGRHEDRAVHAQGRVCRSSSRPVRRAQPRTPVFPSQEGY